MSSRQSSVVGRQSEGLRPLPEGWAWKILSDMVGEEGLFVDGDWVESKDQDPNGDVRLIQLADIGDGYYRNRSDRYLTHEKALNLGCTFLQIGDLLVARMPDPLGRACIFPGDSKKSVTVVDVCVIRTGEGSANHRWLMHAINSPNFRAEVESLQSGSTRKRISRTNLAKIRLPVPPLPEQERIVARLEELLSDLEAGVAALRRVRAGVKRYKASVLKAAVEGKLLESRGIESSESDLPVGWRWVTVGDITESMKNGIYKPAEYYADDGIACLRMYNIEDGAIAWKDIKRMKLTEEEVETYRLLPGDILVNRVNSRELVGKAAVIPNGLESIVYESKNIRLRIKQYLADSTYINYCFGAYRQRYFNFNAQQVVGMASINQPQIAQMPIPLPPLEEQRRIVAEVERRLESARAVESAVEAGLKRAGRLRQAVLRSAFEGRLI